MEKNCLLFAYMWTTLFSLDMILPYLTNLKSMMSEFDMSNLGKMHNFLGIEVVKSVVGIFIS